MGQQFHLVKSISFGEIYSSYEDFVIDCQKIGMKPLTRQSVGILLPAYSWLVYKKEVRKFLRNKTVFYEGVRWRQITYRMMKHIASGGSFDLESWQKKVEAQR